MKLVEVVSNKAKHTYKLFVDLDGVMSNLAGKVSELIGEPYSEERFEKEKEYRKRIWDAVKAYGKQGGKFWEEMDMLPNARALWERIKLYDVEILTATGSSIPSAGEQKRRWVAQHLSPTVKVNLTRTAAEKAKFAAPNHILIVDNIKAIIPWEAAGGIGILHADNKVERTFAALDELGL